MFKDPKPNSPSQKKSQTGLVLVTEQDDVLTLTDDLSVQEYEARKQEDVMKPIFENGKLVREQEGREFVRICWETCRNGDGMGKRWYRTFVKCISVKYIKKRWNSNASHLN